MQFCRWQHKRCDFIYQGVYFFSTRNPVLQEHLLFMMLFILSFWVSISIFGLPGRLNIKIWILINFLAKFNIFRRKIMKTVEWRNCIFLFGQQNLLWNLQSSKPEWYECGAESALSARWTPFLNNVVWLLLFHVVYNVVWFLCLKQYVAINMFCFSCSVFSSSLALNNSEFSTYFISQKLSLFGFEYSSECKQHCHPYEDLLTCLDVNM